MALKGLDSGEATRFPIYTARTAGSWTKPVHEPSAWQVISSNSGYSSEGVATTDPYHGNTHFRVQCTNAAHTAAMRREFGADFSETYLAFHVKFDSLTNAPFFFLRTSADAIAVRLNIDSTGNLLVYAGTTPTLKRTIATAITPNNWHHIELHVKAAVSGTLEIKLDSGAALDCSGTNMSAWRLLEFGNHPTTSILYAQMDSLQVNDTTGTVNNSWPGTPRIPGAIRPNQDTAATDWTRNSEDADYKTIDEPAPDEDNSYIYSSADGDTSIFEFSDMAEPANSLIPGIVLTIVAKRADPAQIIPIVKRGVTSVELDPVDVGPDYMTPIEVIIEEDPIAEGPWTQTNLNDTEFGFKHVVP